MRKSSVLRRRPAAAAARPGPVEPAGTLQVGNATLPPDLVVVVLLHCDLPTLCALLPTARDIRRMVSVCLKSKEWQGSPHGRESLSEASWTTKGLPPELKPAIAMLWAQRGVPSELAQVLGAARLSATAHVTGSPSGPLSRGVILEFFEPSCDEGTFVCEEARYGQAVHLRRVNHERPWWVVIVLVMQRGRADRPWKIYKEVHYPHSELQGPGEYDRHDTTQENVHPCAPEWHAKRCARHPLRLGVWPPEWKDPESTAAAAARVWRSDLDMLCCCKGAVSDSLG